MSAMRKVYLIVVEGDGRLVQGEAAERLPAVVGAVPAD